MRIAHVVWGMKTGGVETMLVNIINEQVKTEEVRLFIINDFIDEFIVEKILPQCQILRLNRKPSNKNPLKILKLNYWICMFRPDIIHVHSSRVSKLIFGNWNIVRTIHNTGNIPEEYPRMKALFAISDVVKEQAFQQGFPNTKTIYNGILTAKVKTRAIERPKDNCYKLVQVSRLDVDQKGQDILIAALGKIVNTFNINNFSLHLIGTGGSEPMLREMVDRLGLESYVTFEGLKDQDFIYNHLCDYDLFVQPSRYEGFGITVAEAMAAKLPVLVSDIEGPMEIIGHGKYGMSFKSKDVDDLAEKLSIILKGGYDYSLIEKAYKHVCEEFEVSTTAQQYVESYYNLLNNR